MVGLGATITGLAVALGAFGAHALRPELEAHGRLDEWETAVLYQLAHGIALLALGIWVRLDPAAAAARTLRVAGGLWVAGVACFSGSLYALCLGAPKGMIWPVTPLGGLCLLAGWLLVAVCAFRGIRPLDDRT